MTDTTIDEAAGRDCAGCASVEGVPARAEGADGGAFDPFDGEPDPSALPTAADLASVERARTEAAERRETADASRRTTDLLANMRADRHALLAILRACSEPCTAEGVTEAARAAAPGPSVYAPETLRRLLEEAGALERVDADGAPYQEEQAQARVVEVGGVEYLEPAEPPRPRWLATQAGRDALAADRPLARIEKLFEDQAVYLPIFKRVLTMCAQGGPTATSAINAAVDPDPLVQNPRRHTPFFTEKLESCDALTWDHGWRTTDEGLEALEMLTDVEG